MSKIRFRSRIQNLFISDSGLDLAMDPFFLKFSEWNSRSSCSESSNVWLNLTLCGFDLTSHKRQ